MINKVIIGSMLFMVLLITSYSFGEESIEKKKIERNKCVEEIMMGVYTEYCDCGARKEIVLKDKSSCYIKEYDEDLMCRRSLSWEFRDNKIYIFSGPQGIFIKEEFIFNDKFPFMQKELDVIGVSSEDTKKRIKQKYNNKTVYAQALYYEKPTEQPNFFDKSIVFYRVYSYDDFNRLKCLENKNVYLKRMIYQEGLSGSNEDQLIKFINKTRKDGLDYNFKDRDGVNALFAAVDNGMVKTTETLLKLGADPLSSNNMGLTVLELSRRNKSKMIETLLIKYGAEKRKKDETTQN